MTHAPSPAPEPHSAPEKPAVASLYTLGAGVLIAATLLTGILYLRSQHKVAEARVALGIVADQGIPILAAPVGISPALRKLTLPGELRPLQEATVYAKLAGYLKAIHVDKGDHVKAGQVIAQVSSPETDQQVINLAADLKNKTQIENRYQALIAGGSVSQQELETARAARASAQAALRGATALKNYETIRAPYTGIITARYADAGVLLPAATGSTQAAQPLVEIQDASWIRIFVYVGQAEAPFVKTGDSIHITSRDLPDLSLQTHITRISGALDPHTRTMLVEVDVDNRMGILTPGLYVQATLDITMPQAMTVPVDAIFLRNGIAYVAAVEDGVAHYIQVKTGLDDGRNVHILEGVEPGMHVGLHIGDSIADGARVRIIEPHHIQVPKKE
jgi:membrane fusion protein (multidrug efflux system)